MLGKPALPTSLLSWPDLDDTLVLTKDVDTQAYQRVCQLGHQLLPGLDQERLLADWRTVFAAQPWDPEHKVGDSYFGKRNWYMGLEKVAACPPQLASPYLHVDPKVCTQKTHSHPRAYPMSTSSWAGASSGPKRCPALRGVGPGHSKAPSSFRFHCFDHPAGRSMTGRTSSLTNSADTSFPFQFVCSLAAIGSRWCVSLGAGGSIPLSN